MKITVELTQAPIVPLKRPLGGGGVGAWVEFEGIVRGEESGQAIAALEYEAYDLMAERVMRELLEKLCERYGCQLGLAIHRLGVIPVGETAIWVGVGSGHRKEALALATEFMDRLKQDVPIWKRRALTAADLERLPR